MYNYKYFRIASPGNRLSHLAKRRAVFSSANLQSQAQLANASKLGQKTCVIDASLVFKLFNFFFK